MNRNMKMALADAHPHGLMRVHNGYKARDARGEPMAFSQLHSPNTVKALGDRCLIDFWGPDRIAHLTELGRNRIEHPDLTEGTT